MLRTLKFSFPDTKIVLKAEPQAEQVRGGITTGYCAVGNFGSKSRIDYTIIGSQVNIASRLEQSADPDQIKFPTKPGLWSRIRSTV